MPSFDMVVNTRRMLRSTPFHRMTKAPERLYYIVLFSTSPAYASRAEVWRSWLQMGFILSMKDPPSEAAEADRLAWTVTSEGTRTAVHLSSPRGEVLETVRTVLQAVEAARPTLAGKDGAAKARALLASKPVSERVLGPASRAFKAAGLRKDESDTLADLLAKALVALADDDIASVSFAVLAGSR